MVLKLKELWTRLATHGSGARREAVFTRTATAAMAGLFGPPMLALPSHDLQWQIWGCLALVTPLIALAQFNARRPSTAFAVFGFVAAAVGAAAAAWPGYMIFLVWLALTWIEAAIILAASRINFGGLFPLGVLFGLAIAERFGLVTANAAILIAAMFAAPAAVPAAMLATSAQKALRARRQLRWLMRRRKDQLSAVGEYLMWLDPKGRVLEAGVDVSKLLQVDADDLLGEALFQRVNVSDRPQFMHSVDRAAFGDDTIVANLRLRVGAVNGPTLPAEPQFRWFEARMRRVSRRGGEGEAVVVAAMRDVSEAKEREQHLEVLRLEATTAVSVKDRLLANVSHELRTPLNAILGFSEVLADPNLTPISSAKRSAYATIIHESASHLLSVVNLLLDMSKLESGRLELSMEPVSAAALIRGCVDMLTLQARDCGVTVSSEIDDASLLFVADKRALRQILLNLLANALKFTPPGGRVSVGAMNVGDMVEISVADTGIGIAPEDIARIGDPFFRTKAACAHSEDGAGLGLALVRSLVGLHGGDLAIASAPAAGTRIIVRLPRKGATPQSAKAHAPRFQVLPGGGRTPVLNEGRLVEERRFG